MSSAYTGVGSRETPSEILLLMQDLARQLSRAFTLRSGGANGADSAFETGCVEGRGPSEIYLPWRGFNGRTSELFHVTSEALTLAQSVHPAWELLSDAAKKLHARNCYQVAGDSLNDPSNFLICWTSDGCETANSRTRKTGGTGTAIALADRFSVPVFNLANTNSRERLADFLLGKGFDVVGLRPSWVAQSLF